MRDAQLPSQSLAAGRHAASRRVELALNGLARFQGPAADRPNSAACPSVNAILNYAYAALESELRIKAISEGYDPTIGIMHEGSDGSSKFIFDLMEPERRKVDRTVLDF